MIAPGGVCSFTAEATKLGAYCTAGDILYAHDKQYIASQAISSLSAIYRDTSWVTQNTMTWYKSLENHRLYREKARALFLDDYSIGNYINVRFPHLRLPRDSFDMALSAHFLFTYANWFHYEFHLTSILSLACTAKEVRIFPLVDLQNSHRNNEKPLHPYVYRLLGDLPLFGLNVHICESLFEFQKGAHQFMKITR